MSTGAGVGATTGTTTAAGTVTGAGVGSGRLGLMMNLRTLNASASVAAAAKSIAV